MNIELDQKECDAIRSICRKLDTVQHKPVARKNWIRIDGYLVNQRTGRRMDIQTKQFIK